VHIPVFLSLLLVLAVLTIAIVASLVHGKPEAAVDDADRAVDDADRAVDDADRAANKTDR
jgi:hypothetical protein